VEHQRTAVVCLDDDNRILDLNPAAELLFGLSIRQTRGENLAAILPHNGAFCAQLENIKQQDRVYMEHGLHLHCPRQGEMIVECTITPLHLEDVRLLLEFIKVERQLQLTREENRAVLEQATRIMVRSLAHEIKNPLGGLRGAAQLLAQQLKEHPGLREHTEIIIAEADRLKHLVDELLGPLRPPHPHLINIQRVVDRVLTLVRAAGHHHVVFQTDYDPSIPELEADHEQLIQALLNIVQNAIEAITEQPGPLKAPGRVLLRTRTQRHFAIGNRLHRLVARIDILDNGPGIPDSIRDQIFYPMVTGRHHGSGLGLSISQELVRRQGGVIVCDKEGEETCFRIYLPIPWPHKERSYGHAP
jgi:two-component system nitrogen regulation sensor histidine kinase GlnL